jgi:hypothetical protein
VNLYTETFFSPDTITTLDFLEIAATFMLVMAVFFGLKNRRHWLNFFLIGVFILQWINALIFKPLPTKLFVTLLLISIIVVEIAVRKRETRVAGNP